MKSYPYYKPPSACGHVPPEKGGNEKAQMFPHFPPFRGGMSRSDRGVYKNPQNTPPCRRGASLLNGCTVVFPDDLLDIAVRIDLDGEFATLTRAIVFPREFSRLTAMSRASEFPKFDTTALTRPFHPDFNAPMLHSKRAGPPAAIECRVSLNRFDFFRYRTMGQRVVRDARIYNSGFERITQVN